MTHKKGKVGSSFDSFLAEQGILDKKKPCFIGVHLRSSAAKLVSAMRWLGLIPRRPPNAG